MELPPTADTLGDQPNMVMITETLMRAPRVKTGILPTFFMMKPKPTEANASHTPYTIRTRPTVWTPYAQVTNPWEKTVFLSLFIIMSAYSCKISSKESLFNA